LSKLGLAGDFPALSGSLIRLIAAATAIWVITFVTRQARPTVATLRAHPRALLALSGGAVTGPFLGVWLSLIAVQRAPLGIAATLTSLAPVILLPLGKIFFQERIGVRAVIGTAAAVAGTVVLFL
jgi:drug/metabolite transporter (DMT)-like permease